MNADTFRRITADFNLLTYYESVLLGVLVHEEQRGEELKRIFLQAQKEKEQARRRDEEEDQEREKMQLRAREEREQQKLRDEEDEQFCLELELGCVTGKVRQGKERQRKLRRKPTQKKKY